MTALDPAPIPPASFPGTGPARPRKTVRFTSNIAGPIYLLSDFACFILSTPVAVVAYGLIRGKPIVPSPHLFALVLMIGSFFMIRSSRRSYERSAFEQVEDLSVVVFDAVVSWLIASALIWQIGMIEDYSRGLALAFIISLASCLVVSRPLVRRVVTHWAAKGYIQQRIALYAANADAVTAVHRLITSLDLQHVRIVGIVDERSRDHSNDLQLIGGIEQLRRLARNGDVDQVLICGLNFTAARLADVVEQLSDVAIDVSVIPREAIDFEGPYKVNLLGTWPVMTLWQRPFRDVNQVVKRGEDVVIGGAAVLLLLPVLLIAALLVRFSSRGPVLFVQPRVGFNNEVINVFKFRTMYAEHTDVGGRVTTSKQDPRITPIGRILRKLSIDELPQLFNVLNGSMSLVGPRPHAIEMKVGDRYYHEAVRGYAGRHRVKPGITGLAQVRGLRGEVRTIERAKKRVELDQYYLDNWSLWLDVKILFATTRAVFFDGDAY